MSDDKNIKEHLREAIIVGLQDETGDAVKWAPQALNYLKFYPEEGERDLGGVVLTGPRKGVLADLVVPRVPN